MRKTHETVLELATLFIITKAISLYGPANLTILNIGSTEFLVLLLVQPLLETDSRRFALCTRPLLPFRRSFVRKNCS